MAEADKEGYRERTPNLNRSISSLNSTEYVVIHNPMEDGEETAPSLECQLEQAMEKKYLVIVVEPPGLGNDCIRWIKVGNFLHKSSVLTGVAALLAAPFVRTTKIALFSTVPLGVFGATCAIMYSLVWQSDPCCRYQVDYKGRMLTRIPSHDIHNSNLVVLVQRNDKYRKILHNTVSVVVLGYVSWTIYKFVRSCFD